MIFFFLIYCGTRDEWEGIAGFLPIKEILPKSHLPAPQYLFFPPNTVPGEGDTTSPAPQPSPPSVVVVHLHPCLFLLLQHVEDPGINIPDQTVIKKGKPFPCAYQTCRYRLGTTRREDLLGLPPPPPALGSFLWHVLLAERLGAENEHGRCGFNPLLK